MEFSLFCGRITRHGFQPLLCGVHCQSRFSPLQDEAIHLFVYPFAYKVNVKSFSWNLTVLYRLCGKMKYCMNDKCCLFKKSVCRIIYLYKFTITYVQWVKFSKFSSIGKWTLKHSIFVLRILYKRHGKQNRAMSFFYKVVKRDRFCVF